MIGWTIETTNGAVVRQVEIADAVHGHYALEADFTQATDTARATIEANLVTCAPGETVQLTGWYRWMWQAEGYFSLGVYLRFRDSSLQLLEELVAPVIKSTDWQRTELTGNAPANTAWVQVAIVAFAVNGYQTKYRAHVDNFDLRKTRRQRKGHVIGLSWRYAADHGYRQTIQLLDARSLYPYDNYFIVGETALGAVGRAWY